MALAIGIFLLGLILYYATKRKYPALLFLSGVGAGIAIAGIFVYYASMQ